MAYEDLDLDDTAQILEHHHGLAHPRYTELLSQPDHVLASPGPMTAEQALRAAIRLPADDPLKTEKQRLAAKEYSIETLVRGHGSDTKADRVNKWLLHQLRISPMSVLLLRSVFGSSRLRIRDYWRWQCDVLYYWWRDGTMMQRDDGSMISTTDMFEFSGHGGTSKPSESHLGRRCPPEAQINPADEDQCCFTLKVS
ncbi:hypothetical protein EsDP_00003126 [Epichloe bromicola]|uniref:Uncharacterized protein n=1 Tax=Epichloe bromicola TaxID=79588 RepID=A0ABQ0CMV8_9HYPO